MTNLKQGNITCGAVLLSGLVIVLGGMSVQPATVGGIRVCELFCMLAPRHPRKQHGLYPIPRQDNNKAVDDARLAERTVNVAGYALSSAGRSFLWKTRKMLHPMLRTQRHGATHIACTVHAVSAMLPHTFIHALPYPPLPYPPLSPFSAQSNAGYISMHMAHKQPCCHSLLAGYAHSEF